MNPILKLGDFIHAPDSGQLLQIEEISGLLNRDGTHSWLYRLENSISWWTYQQLMSTYLEVWKAKNARAAWRDGPSTRPITSADL